ncbi:MAG: NB-ARC domain-containing protein, partial [Bacteroidia bacterium]
MRKILENTITILAELLILGLCIVWYIQSKEIEPLVGIVASGAALLSSLAMRFFPEKEEEKQQETLVNKTTIKEKTNVVEKSKIKGHDVIIGSGSNITKIKKQIIRYDQGHEIPRIISPTTPMYPQYFIGRETKLTEIHTRLHEEDHFLLLVNGNGGMGKTTIASRYFFDYEEDFQHLAWVFCEEKIADALLTLSPALGLKFEKEQEEERLSLLFHKLSNLKKPSLLIIDNANEDTDVDLFYPRLAALPNLKVIFTSRVTDLNDIPQIRIGELSEEKTLELFKHYY